MSDQANTLDELAFRIGLSKEQAAEQPDPEAPFGRNEDDTPVAPFGFRLDGGVKLRPGKKAAKTPSDSRPAAPRTAPQRRGAPRRPTGGSSSPSPAGKRGGTPKADYTDAIRRVADDAYRLLLWVGDHDPIYYADAAVIATIKDPLAVGLNPVVADSPWLVKAVTWYDQNREHTGLGLALASATAQLAANHLPRLRSRLVRAGLAVDPQLIITGVELELLQAEADDHEATAAKLARLEQLRDHVTQLRDAANRPADADDDTETFGPDAPAPDDLVGQHDKLHGLTGSAHVGF